MYPNICIQIGCNPKKKRDSQSLVNLYFSEWSHLGLNQGPPDYESDALTN